MTTYVLGGGCFWCIDAVFRRIQGVTRVESGYAGGEGTPNYYKVATGTTSFAEVVRITFDETTIAANTILDIFFLIHDPTTRNRQGADEGPQYRSVMFYKDNQQKEMFKKAIERATNIWNDPIVTELTQLEIFYLAEEEHQDYFNKNPDSGYCSIVITPKIIKARKAYAKWFKEKSL